MATAKWKKRDLSALRLELKNLQKEIKKLLELDRFPAVVGLLTGNAYPVIDEAEV